MDTTSGEKIKGKALKMVRCRMVSPRAFRTLEACKACEHFKGLQETRPEGQLGLPAAYEVICGVPVTLPVEDLILEEKE